VQIGHGSPANRLHLCAGGCKISGRKISSSEGAREQNGSKLLPKGAKARYTTEPTQCSHRLPPPMPLMSSRARRSAAAA
jgi:hypothetical protein